MKTLQLRNTSSYHTATIRKIIVTTRRALNSAHSNWDKWSFRVEVKEGRVRVNYLWRTYGDAPPPAQPTLIIRVPKLTGSEFIPLLRQQHGGTPVRTFSNPADPKFGKPIGAHGGLLSHDIALAIQQVTYEHFNWDPTRYGYGSASELSADIRAALIKAKVPQYVPLRVRKPPKEEEPKDIVAERYKRVLALEARWKTKQKLATTKLKKLRVKRRHYEKKLDKRNHNKEE